MSDERRGWKRRNQWGWGIGLNNASLHANNQCGNRSLFILERSPVIDRAEGWFLSL
jgi:hypothetical protein